VHKLFTTPRGGDFLMTRNVRLLPSGSRLTPPLLPPPPRSS
jgi:hypothetical protein